jgi:hypothetical protein
VVRNDEAWAGQIDNVEGRDARRCCRQSTTI